MSSAGMPGRCTLRFNESDPDPTISERSRSTISAGSVTAIVWSAGRVVGPSRNDA